MIRLLYGLDGLFSRIPHSFIALLGRLAIGLVFWNSGRTKVQGWNIFDVSETTLYLFQNDYKVPLLPPEVAALMAQVAENTLPILLFIGLATRYAAV
ncbi:MAG: DoxX family protein, partial [Aestuariivirga sp.]